MTEKIVKDFKFMANLFASEWDYTRNHHLKSIRYNDDYNTFDKFSSRLKHSLECLYKRDGIFASELFKPWTFKSRLFLALHFLQRDPNLPDGSLAGGKIITYWEEDGEYLQLVQPSVGSLIADFLEQEPENPHAKLIVKEMKRIKRDYAKRLKEEKSSD